MVTNEALTAAGEGFVGGSPSVRPPAALRPRVASVVDYQRRLHEAELAVVSWPKEYGGRGLSLFDAITVAEALGRAGAPELVNFVAIEVVAPALMAFADDEQLSRWLPPMASAESVW